MYEWDPHKAEANLERHGVAFESAEEFDWQTAAILEDDRKDYGEKRYLAYGLIGERLHVMVFTPRQKKVRIIGLRKANARERKCYEQSDKTTTYH